MRRQDSCSSDMRLDTAASASARHGDPNVKTIGCMSGIICCLSKYHRTNVWKCKFLTFGKKNSGLLGNGSSSHGSSSTITQSASSFRIMARLTELNKTEDRTPSSRISYLQSSVARDVVPRSPKYPPRIQRRSETPLVIARVMGLKEAEAPSKEVQDQYYYSRIAIQKRQRLLGALKKCDRDLKALKKMIEAIGKPPKRPLEAIENTNYNEIKMRSCGGVILKKRELPSCVSVLEDESNHLYHYYSKTQALLDLNYVRAHQVKTPAGEEDNCLRNPHSLIGKFTTGLSTETFDEKKTHPDYNVAVEDNTVDQVYRDIAWGEKREMGRICLALQDQICKSLIQELVVEMNCLKHTSPVYSLPFEACKRRLSF